MKTKKTLPAKRALPKKVRKGDVVVVISGKDKGKKGAILSVIPKEDRVIVSGINIVKRHTPARKDQPAKIVTKEASLHISNVMLEDPKTKKPTRVGMKHLDDGTKVRFAKVSGEMIESRK